MKTFIDYIAEQESTDLELKILLESLESEWSDELEVKVDAALESFMSTYKNKDGSYNIHEFNEELTNEGILGSIFGGLAGFALGKTVGKTVAKILGIEKGIFYDMLTSRLVGAALGSALANKI